MSSVGKWTMLGGLFIMLGPIAIFLFVSALPQLFSQSTVLFWHYFSAFGLIVYVPLGLAVIAVGWAIKYKSLRAEERLRD